MSFIGESFIGEFCYFTSNSLVMVVLLIIYISKDKYTVVKSQKSQSKKWLSVVWHRVAACQVASSGRRNVAFDASSI